MDEQELVELLRAGDDAGAEALLKHYGPLMRYIIAPILPNSHDREEFLSEVVMRIWEKIGSYDPERGSWKGWLTALTRNAALNRARRNGRADEAELSADLPVQGPGPEEELLLRERREALNRALARLSARDQALFYRKYYYLQSTAQIATEVGLTPRAVEGKLYRIKKRLRELLRGDGYER